MSAKVSLRLGALTITLMILLGSPASASVWLADYRGYDYTWPLPEDFTSPGQFYSALGPVLSMNEDFFVLDEDNFEYTIHIHSGALTSWETVGNFTFYYYEGGDGTIDFFEDSRTTGTNFEFGEYPPNDTAPSTFVDGRLMLGGSFSYFRIVVDSVDGDGSFSGVIDFDRGDDLQNIPPDMRDGWTFSGLGLGHPPFTPEGYMNQLDGEVYLEQATPIEESSWGRIKHLFAR